MASAVPPRDLLQTFRRWRDLRDLYLQLDDQGKERIWLEWTSLETAILHHHPSSAFELLLMTIVLREDFEADRMDRGDIAFLNATGGFLLSTLMEDSPSRDEIGMLDKLFTGLALSPLLLKNGLPRDKDQQPSG